MKFDNIRQILSYAVENFGKQMFETEKFNDFVESALDESGKWHQRDCPLKAPFMVRFALMLILFRYLSIVNILKKLLHQFRHLIPNLSLKAITPEALCHARERLGAEPLRILFEKIAAEVKLYSCFHDLPIVGVDGTKFNVPDTPKNDDYFGRPKVARAEAAHPRMEAVTLVDTSTRQIRAVEIMRCNSSERDGFLKLFDKLRKNALVLMDRGISAYWLLEMLLDRSKHFLVRISASWKFDFKKRLGDGDFLVTARGRIPKKRQKGRKNTKKLTLRLIRYKIGESETVCLLTDLLDPKKYSARELALLYHSRWECELAYDELKNHLSTTAAGAQDLLFRSKTPEGVLQEAYALFTLYNIIRGFMAEAGRLYDINPLDISFVDSAQIIRETTPRFQTAGSEDRQLQVLSQMLRDIAESVNRRPRRNRKYPRAVKKKMSNYNRKRQDCRQEFTDIDRDLKLVG